MKVMHVVYCLDVGGLEKFVLNLIDEYSDSIESTIVCLTSKGPLSDNFKGEIYYIGISQGLRISTFTKIFSLIKIIKPDVIHAHNQASGFYSSIAAVLTKVPVIYTKHGRHDRNTQNNRPLEKYFHLFVDKIVCVSDDVKQLCHDNYKLPAFKIDVILNGIDTSIFNTIGSDDNTISSIENKCTVIGCIARLMPVKDHITLLKACNVLKEKNINFKLIMAGDGDCLNSINDFIDATGLRSFVQVLGTRHDVNVLLPTFDIFALSSISEGISLTLLEAMSCGLPVVATNVGGNPEVVVDSYTGYLVPVSNPEAFADKLLYLISNRELRVQMGVRGRQRVIEKFGIKETARKYEKLYSSVLVKR